MKSPYEILGVTSKASQEEIKKAYRTLVKKYHPDRNPNNKKAEERFKEIAHAFDLIGTPEARGKFDRGETSEQQQEQQQKQYEQYQRYQDQRGGRSFHSFENDFADEDFFQNIFREARNAKRPRGHDHHYKMEVDFKESVLGGSKVITLQTGKKLEVKIPPGIESGTKLRFKKQGEAGGDAYVEILVRPLKGFKRVGSDIQVEVPVSFIEAILGGEIQVPTIDGSVILKVPPGVTTGSKLRIRGKGINTTKNQGDEIVILRVEIPKKVTPELTDEIKNLAQKFSYNPRLQ